MRNLTRQLIRVGDNEFSWSIYRQPQWCTVDGYKGLAIRVEALNGSGRYLILEFPFELKTHFSAPHKQRPTISEKELSFHVSKALEDGWNPESRGKPFIFYISKD